MWCFTYWFISGVQVCWRVDFPQSTDLKKGSECWGERRQGEVFQSDQIKCTLRRFRWRLAEATETLHPRNKPLGHFKAATNITSGLKISTNWLIAEHTDKLKEVFFSCPYNSLDIHQKNRFWINTLNQWSKKCGTHPKKWDVWKFGWGPSFSQKKKRWIK